MQILAARYGMQFVDLSAVEIPPELIKLIPESVARKHLVLPLEKPENGWLKIIISDPLDFLAVDEVRSVLDQDIELALAPREAIQETIDRMYGPKGLE